MRLEPYQDEAATFLSRRKRALLISPAASGKTIMLAAALDRALSARQRDRLVRVGWMANTREQIQQAAAALAQFPDIARLAEVKLACSAAATDWSDRDLLIIDEAHHIGIDNGWHRQAESCPGAIWGCTATPEVEDELRDEALLRFFEHCVFRVNREQVAKRLVAARVLMLPDFEPGWEMEIDQRTHELIAQRRRQTRGAMSEGEMYRMCSWQAVAEVGIQGNAARNGAAVAAARKHMASGRVLVLVNWTEHAEWFVHALGSQAAVCHAKLGKKKRQAVLDGVRSGEVRAMVATSLADEGLDLPELSTLVLASGGRSRAKAEQRTGRVLRAFSGKAEGLIYDFADMPHPLMRKHAHARVALYRELGYQVEFLSSS